MGRPLTGTSRRVAGGHLRELPTAPGSRERTRRVFSDEQAADAWLAAGIAALRAGRPLPQPDPSALVGGSPRPSGTSFRTMATAWHAERYRELRRGGATRDRAVLSIIDAIATWIEQQGLAIETMARDRVKEYLVGLANAPRELPGAPAIPQGLAPGDLLTMDEAVALAGLPSESTLKRRQKEGVLPTHVRADGRVAFRVAELFASDVCGGPGGLRRGPRRSHGYAQEVIADHYRVIEGVLAYAADHGVDVPRDRESLALPLTDRPAVTPQWVPLDVCVTIAGTLHVVHQTALWLMRVLGLRISEAYGIRVGDVIDLGPGGHGIVAIRAQGGRRFDDRDPDSGELTRVDRMERTKTTTSVRVLVVPRALMDLLRTVIEVFHTGDLGVVRTDARLIPGLTREDSSGQAAFRDALGIACEGMLRSNGVDLERALSATPHDLRRSVCSDLEHVLKIHGVKARRFAGHAAGDDVHARSYVLDDPLLRPGREVADALQRQLDEELPAGLMVPTRQRCTTGAQPALAEDGARLDAELALRGWLVRPGHRGEELLTAGEVASALGCTVQTARRWMREGVVPSVILTQRARGEERGALLADVLAVGERMRAQVTIADLAEEVAQTYHTVYQYVRASGLPTERVGRTCWLPAEAVEHVRGHYRHQAELHSRAVPLSVAAATLRATLPEVEHLLARGILIGDDPAHDGRRMVSRESVEQVLADRQRSRPRSSAARKPSPVVTVPRSEVRRILELTDAQIDVLVADGTLVQMVVHRVRLITRESLLQHLVNTTPDLVAHVLGDGVQWWPRDVAMSSRSSAMSDSS